MSQILKHRPFVGPSFTLGNRLRRLFWSVTWVFLFRLSPVPLHAWRVLLLRCWGAVIGQSCHIYPDVVIWAPWQLSMGDFSCLGRHVNCYNMGLVEIADRVVISQGVHLCTGSHDYESQNFQLYVKPIRIDSDAWVCTESFLAPGVTIGQGTVIGARSVVTRDQAAWMVCAGNPCKPIKARIISKE